MPPRLAVAAAHVVAVQPGGFSFHQSSLLAAVDAVLYHRSPPPPTVAALKQRAHLRTALATPLPLTPSEGGVDTRVAPGELHPEADRGRIREAAGIGTVEAVEPLARQPAFAGRMVAALLSGTAVRCGRVPGWGWPTTARRRLRPPRRPSPLKRRRRPTSAGAIGQWLSLAAKGGGRGCRTPHAATK